VQTIVEMDVAAFRTRRTAAVAVWQTVVQLSGRLKAAALDGASVTLKLKSEELKPRTGACLIHARLPPAIKDRDRRPVTLLRREALAQACV
jgi:hypothetical protein